MTSIQTMSAAAVGTGGRAAGEAGTADVSRPVQQLLARDGEDCAGDAECESGHCNRGICCAGGQCCKADAECPPVTGARASCEQPNTCQSTRQEAACERFRCGMREGVPDDSACGLDIVADECGPYRARTCNGTANQAAPICPTACQNDADCDPGAHCDGKCVVDSPNGSVCNQNTDCASAHCSNGRCCAKGDCCMAPADCARYERRVACVDPTSCQGIRTDATCVDFECGSMVVEDDSACGPNLLARACGAGRDVFCTGQASQIAVCELRCTSDAQCDPNAHCAQGMCVADVGVGSTCSQNADCESGHCANSVCCAGGECCGRPEDCPAALPICHPQRYVCEAAPPMPPNPDPTMP